MKTRLVVFLLLSVVLGCGGDREKGMNSPNQRKDLPRAAPTSQADKVTR